MWDAGNWESKCGMQVAGGLRGCSADARLSILTLSECVAAVSLPARQLLQFLPRHSCSIWAARDFKVLTVCRSPL